MALGCIGISYDDFCALSPAEFHQVHQSWAELETDRLHGDWERTRILATISVQPHLKKAIKPQKLLPLPWDKKARTKVSKPSTRERFDEIVKRTEEYELNNQHNLQTAGGCEDLQGTDQSG